MKKLLLTLGIIISAVQVFAANGDITIINQNSKFSNSDSVSVQIIPSSPENDSFYAKNINSGDSSTINSNQFQDSKKYSLFVADSSQSGTYRRCLIDIDYDPNSKPITIAVANTDVDPSYNQCYCTIEGSQNSCVYPTTEYKQIRGQANIPW